MEKNKNNLKLQYWLLFKNKHFYTMYIVLVLFILYYYIDSISNIGMPQYLYLGPMPLISAYFVSIFIRIPNQFYLYTIAAITGFFGVIYSYWFVPYTIMLIDSIIYGLVSLYFAWISILLYQYGIGRAIPILIIFRLITIIPNWIENLPSISSFYTVLYFIILYFIGRSLYLKTILISKNKSFSSTLKSNIYCVDTYLTSILYTSFFISVTFITKTIIIMLTLALLYWITTSYKSILSLKEETFGQGELKRINYIGFLEQKAFIYKCLLFSVFTIPSIFFNTNIINFEVNEVQFIIIVLMIFRTINLIYESSKEISFYD